MTITNNPEGPQPAYVQAAQPGTSGFAITALVTGIVGLCLSWVPGIGLILGIIATTFGALGWHQAKARGRKGFGLAIAGLVCGILTVAVFVTVVVIAVAGSSGTA